jgi:3-oxoadipate enol-lactonase
LTGLAYDVSGDGRCVALLHAGICDARMWEPTLPALRPGHRVLSYDLRGFGRSAWATGGEFSHVEDLAAVLDAAGMASATLVGASHGAKVAIDAAIELPERVDALLLVAPAVGGWEWSEEIVAYGEREDELFASGDLDACVELNLRTWVDGPARGPEDVAADVRDLVGVMQRRALDLYADALASGPEPGPERALEPPAVARLGEIAVPTTVVLGALDQPDVMQIGSTLVTGIRGATLETIEAVAHLPSMERPGEFARIAGRFLDSLPG